MKTLEKLTLKELGNSCALMESAEANCLKGGTTEAEFLAAVDAGTWAGGQVDGLGYCAPVGTLTATKFAIEHCSMCDQFASSSTYGIGSRYPALEASARLTHSLTHLHDRYTTYTYGYSTNFTYPGQ